MLTHLFGYPAEFSVQAGGRLGFHTSTSAQTFDVDVVRLFNTDPNPDGPGIRMEATELVAPFSVKGKAHDSARGSYIRVDKALDFVGVDALEIGARIWPTRLDEDVRWILRLEGPHVLMALGLTSTSLVFDICKDGHTVRSTTPLHMKIRRWAQISLRFSPVTGKVVFAEDERGAMSSLAIGHSFHIDRILIAGGNDRGSFDGKVEEPFIRQQSDGVWDDVARWDFSQGIGTDIAHDLSASGLHGKVINEPLRAVTGSLWTGAEMCWRHKPAHYAAIWFHTDDVADCGWPESFRLAIPDDMSAGLYAARLRSDDREDLIPFTVRTGPQREKARIAVLLPTFTYMAYANVAFGHSRKPEYRDRVNRWGAYPHHADDHPDFGRSLYDRHDDGSGIALSSRLRPILNFRPGALHIHDPAGSGVRHFVADTHLIEWLDREGLACEILTDEDLDGEGSAALTGHDILLTGTHPEYHTSRTLDAIEAFVERGGRVAYLGGNGFYWRIARSQKKPHLIELRRAEGGVRAWEPEPGESYHAIDGTYGGMWRRNGRPPQVLVGVGFSALGGYEAKPYRRCAVSYEEKYAWLFEGIDGDVLGDFGLVCGGAAGYEMDRADANLGSPDNLVILATSAAEHYATFSPAPEDVLAPGLSRAYGPTDDLIRADMTCFDTQSGGAVFAVGSITFCGSLLGNDRRNAISQLLGNLLNGWLDDSTIAAGAQT